MVFPNVSSTLTCTGDAVIGQADPTGLNTIVLSTSSTVSGCTFGNVSFMTPDPSPISPSGIRIVNNTFSGVATSTISLNGGAVNFEISGNTNINFVDFKQTTSTNGLIENNTFYGSRGVDQTIMLRTSPSSSQIRILNNTFTSYVTNPATVYMAVQIEGFDQTFATNTVRYVVTPPSTMYASLLSHASGTNYIGGNFIEVPPVAGAAGIDVWKGDDQPWVSQYAIAHNTIRASGGASGGCVGIELTDGWGYLSLSSSTVDFSYNLLLNDSTVLCDRKGISVRRSSSSVPITQTNSYNGVYGFTGGVIVETGVESSDVSDVTTRTSNPFLKVNDIDATNDLQTASFSPYLDVNGTEDIGATSISRVNDIYVDDGGTIDYGGVAGVDATSTGDIASFLRTGDTVHLAAGTYRAFNVNSANATSSITIQGVGVATVIDAQDNENAITFTNVSSSNITSLLVQNASSTGAAAYTGSRMNFTTSSRDYNDVSAPQEIPVNATLYFTNPADCDISWYTADGEVLTSFLGTGSIHVALMDVMGAKETLLVPNSVAANASALQVIFTACGAGTVEQFIPSVFTKSVGVYTYQPTALSGVGVTLTAGATDPPTITRTTPSYAGIRLAGTSNHITVTSVTSTRNADGIVFATTNNGYNTISESEFSLNASYDINSASNATNTFDNSSFNRTSSTITGAGPIAVYFDARVGTFRAGNSAALSSSSITATDAASAVSALGTTAGSGYTSFLSLPAYKLTSASSALTNGGYNPYVMDASAVTGYNASSTNVNIASRNQSILVYLSSTSAPSAPSSPTISSIGATSATLSWSDNSDDETAFVVDYINLSTGETFPGTTSTVDVNSVTTSVGSLLANVTYQMRVQATSTSGGSAYVTASSFTTLASVPSAPTVSALSQTSVSVLINSNGNSTSTKFALYSSTLGGYLNALGVAGVTPTWQTTSTWATLTVASLTCNTPYTFSALARNINLELTATSTGTTVSTSACTLAAVSSSSGGGGVGSGSSSALPSTFDYTRRAVGILPVSFTPVVLSDVTPAAGTSTPVPLPPASPQTIAALQASARTFGITLAPADLARLASFIETGTTDATRRLGSGERYAMIIDLMDTMRRSNISTTDLERLASGLVPLSRNIAQEGIQLPRVRATFRSVYGHDPVFSNPEENTAWNTLMYRIRFPRDLVLERRGIQAFTRVYRRAPRNSFQWAAVRVWGYVRQ